MCGLRACLMYTNSKYGPKLPTSGTRSYRLSASSGIACILLCVTSVYIHTPNTTTAMNMTHEISDSGRINSASNPVWMDGLRIALGLFLFVKGIMFLQHNTDVFYIFSQQQDIIGAQKASVFTSVVHIIGGLMIAFGFLTRLSILCQIPLVLGAVLIVNPARGLHIENTELWIAVVILALLIFFMIVGPGRYSVDNKVLRPKHPTSN